jgi:hypothetical protein
MKQVFTTLISRAYPLHETRHRQFGMALTLSLTVN